MNTLFLDENWDLTVDASRNIAMATEPYSIAQDAASACRLFSGELWYDTTKGIPYFARILGVSPPPRELLRQLYVAAALSVPDAVTAACYFTGMAGRELTGQIQINGVAVSF